MMTKQVYKYSLLLSLFMVCSSLIHAQHHIMRFGLKGGGQYNVAQYEKLVPNKVGFAGSVGMDCVFYMSSPADSASTSIDLGVRLGVNIGYQNAKYNLGFSDHYTTRDYLDNIIDYTTSGECQVKCNQVTAEVPLMFALRAKGVIFDIGPMFRVAVHRSGQQSFVDPMVVAYYPAYGVEVPNEIITGVLAEEQMVQPISLTKPKARFDIYVGTEIGYEWNQMVGVLGYFHVGCWNNMRTEYDSPIIQVTPPAHISEEVSTVATANVYEIVASNSIPLEFGVKVYYAFNLGKKEE